MSWHFSRALVGEYLEENSSGGGLSVALSLSPSAKAFSSHGKTIQSLSRSLSGMTCERLTAFHGEELLTWYLAGFRAKTSVLPEKEKDLPARVLDCGESLPESFARFDRDSRSWKTLQCSPAGESQPFLGTWPRWGLMRNGECSERKMPPGVKATRSRITNAIASGFVRYPTPRANDAQKRGNFDASHPRNGLAGFVRRYPTPTATDSNKWNNMTAEERISKGQQVRLPNALRSELGVVVGGAQNPEFTEWLMGWPIGWTDLRPLATAKFQQWLDSHGKPSSPEQL